VIEVRPFKPFHVDLLRAQGVQASQLAEVSHVPATYASVASSPQGPAATVFDGDHVVLCGGIVIQAPARGECWALLSEDAGRHMRWLHYAAKRFLTMQHWRRLEASVEEGFGPGCRWMELLGFEFEGTMKGYGLNGETHLRYARIG
jgi:hypothetical protein